LIKRAAVLFPCVALAACAHFPTKPNNKKIPRLGVVIIDEGFTEYADASDDVKKKANAERLKLQRESLEEYKKRAQEAEKAGRKIEAVSPEQYARPSAEPKYIWSPICKKQFLTRYTRVRQDRARGNTFAWLLVNSCKTRPPRCKAPLEIAFDKWEYTPEIIYAGTEPTIPYRLTDRTPFLGGTCRVSRPVLSQTVTQFNCKFRPDLEKGTWRFQAVLQCGDQKLDNWDPEIVVDDNWKGEGEGEEEGEPVN